MKAQIKHTAKKTGRKLTNQLVLFDKKELDIIYKNKLSKIGMENIKKMKHLFSGELVSETV